MKKTILMVAVALSMAASFGSTAMPIEASGHDQHFKADKTYSVAATPIAAVKESLPLIANDRVAFINAGMFQHELELSGTLMRSSVTLSTSIPGVSHDNEHWRNRETNALQRST